MRPLHRTASEVLRRARSVGLAAAATLTAALPVVPAHAAATPIPAHPVVVPFTAASAAASFTDGKCTSGDMTSVTVVIDFQQLGGGTIVRCGHGLAPGARGNKALAAAGITYEGTTRYGAAFVCRILGRPGPTETLHTNTGDYREPCTDTPPANAYWSYWQANEGGNWEYSQLGVLPQKARLGGFEGWSFSMNATAETNPQPRIDTSLPAPAPSTTAEPPPTSAPEPTTAKPPATPSTSRPGVPPTARTTRARPTVSRTTSNTRTTSADGTAQPPGGSKTDIAPVPDTPTESTAPSSVPAEGTSTGTTADGPATAATSATAHPGTARPSAVRPSTPVGPPTTARTVRPSSGAPRTTGTDRSPVTTSGGPSRSGPATSPAASPSDITPDEAAAVDPPASDPAQTGSAWPALAVVGLAVVAGATAFVLARRRRESSR